MGYSWRWLFALWLGLLPFKASADEAGASGAAELGEGGAAPVRPSHILSPRAAVPANGALLIESVDRTEPIVTVYDPLGTQLTGTMVLLTTADTAFYAWKPQVPFTEGKHKASLTHVDPTQEINVQVEFEISDAMTDDLPEIVAAPSASSVDGPSASACCTTPIRDVLELCTTVEYTAVIHVEPGLSSMDTVGKTNQYLFRLRAMDGSAEHVESDGFKPLGQIIPLTFKVAASQFCFDIETLNIATREVRAYPTRNCVESGDLRAGVRALPPETSVLTDKACLQPPLGYEAQWCSANQGTCSASGSCKLYLYACQGGPLPRAWREAARLHPERNIPLNGEDPEPGGCVVLEPSARTTHGATGSLYLAVSALLLRRATRRRAAP